MECKSGDLNSLTVSTWHRYICKTREREREKKGKEESEKNAI